MKGKSLFSDISYSVTKVTIWIWDDGIRIFRKIRTALNLEIDLHAVFELSKGKLTTDPANHTGEGIFFTSRIYRVVILNFKNVEIIGQAFADEIFRVFVNKNPNTRLSYINTNEQVKKMILRITGR
ncbi:STAS-like domain-containing protein [candidate division KSB1 bacterium]|nr:STAS-like domain-containing protein [candidate division KSB1 bacterium]MBL7095777.1 STAS-like domain-containing protein [candidate division KSB1 bacterium]